MKRDQFNPTLAEQWAQLAINCIHQEYPHVHRYWLNHDDDLRVPRQLNPAFYGCLDWHSAVHSHWMLVRLIRYFPDEPFTSVARQAIAINLTPANISKETTYLQSQPQFECPYGLAWLLQLVAELTEWNDLQGQQWLRGLQPLIDVAINNLQKWLYRLSYPNRTGTHQQTAFALGLIWDWATLTNDQPLQDLLSNFASTFYLNDRNYPLSIEPLGCDFLSPTLAEADFMGRILPPEAFADWFGHFLPQLPTTFATDWLTPVRINHPEDYHQSHLEGLNLSRAWMLEGIAAALPQQDDRIPSLPKWSKKAHTITLVWCWDELRPTKNASSSTWGDPGLGQHSLTGVRVPLVGKPDRGRTACDFRRRGDTGPPEERGCVRTQVPHLESPVVSPTRCWEPGGGPTACV